MSPRLYLKTERKTEKISGISWSPSLGIQEHHDHNHPSIAMPSHSSRNYISRTKQEKEKSFLNYHHPQLKAVKFQCNLPGYHFYCNFHFQMRGWATIPTINALTMGRNLVWNSVVLCIQCPIWWCDSMLRVLPFSQVPSVIVFWLFCVFVLMIF